MAQLCFQSRQALAPHIHIALTGTRIAVTGTRELGEERQDISRAAIAWMVVLLQEVDETLHMGQGSPRAILLALAEQVDGQLG